MRVQSILAAISLSASAGWSGAGLAQEDNDLKNALQSLPTRFSITHPGFPVEIAKGYTNPNIKNHQEENTPLVIHFNDDRFHGKQSGRMSDQHDRGLWDSVYETKYEGTFRDGVLRGSFENHTVKRFHWEPGPYMDYTYYGSLRGTMNPQGKLTVTVTWSWRKVLLRSTDSSGKQGDWDDRSSDPGYGPLPAPYPLIIQLPVSGVDTTVLPDSDSLPMEIPGATNPDSSISTIAGNNLLKIPFAMTAMAGAAAAGLTALGAGLTMLSSGVSPGEVIGGVKEFLGGSTEPPDSGPPSVTIEDDFEHWKRGYESRGWRYSENNGVAEFEPVEGATNESGWTYSEERDGFTPPEDQRPQPEAPPADASYKEEVRLLQEDLERQRDFLDRERERLRQYEQSGLDEQIPGTRERIRQYEKLSNLNQSELERLNEDRPTHTVEDNRDLEADTGERLRSRDIIQQINEGDKKIAAGSETIVEREREIDQLEEEIQSIEQNSRLDPESSNLEKKFLEQQEELLKDGYRVANPGYDAPNLVIREAIDGTALVIDKSGLGGLIVEDFKAINCGDFAEIGQEKTQSFVNQLYGEKADEVIVDKVFVDVIRDDSLGGQVKQLLDVVAPKNHVANRVILPDGRRYILDYWEGNRGRNIRMVSEEEWLERWRERLGEDVRYIGSDDGFVRGAQINVMNQAELFESRGQTAEEAFKSIRKGQSNIINRSSRPAVEKERQLKQLDTLIKSYRHSGRFHSEGVDCYDK